MFDDWYLPRVFYRVVAILLCVCHSLTREVLLWCVPGIFFKCRFWFSMSGVVKLHLSNRIPTGADAAGSGTTRRKVRPLSALNLFLLLSPALSLCLSHTDTILSSYYIYIYIWKVKMTVIQSCPTLCDPMDYTVHGLLHARILELVAFLFSRASSQPRDQTQVSHIAGESLPAEPQGSPRISEWVACPFSSRSSQPRNRTGVSCIAGGFFTNWVIREAPVYENVLTKCQE